MLDFGFLNSIKKLVASVKDDSSTTRSIANTNNSVLGTVASRLGNDAEASSATGSVHQKLKDIKANTGSDADASSATGSLHAKLKDIRTYAVGANSNSNSVNTNVGSNADASSATGSVHAKLKDIKANLPTDTSTTDALRDGYFSILPTSLTACPVNIGMGSTACYDGNDIIYVWTGYTTKKFYKYVISTNAWTELANPVTAYSISGSASVTSMCIHPSVTDKLYFVANGSDDSIAYYTISTNTWAVIDQVNYNTAYWQYPTAVPIPQTNLILFLDGDANTGYWGLVNASTSVKVTNSDVGTGITDLYPPKAVYLNGQIYMFGYFYSSTSANCRLGLDVFYFKNNYLFLQQGGTLGTSSSSTSPFFGGTGRYGKSWFATPFWFYNLNEITGAVLKFKPEVLLESQLPKAEYVANITMGSDYTDDCRGCSMVWTGGTSVYVLRGADNNTFLKYDIVSRETVASRVRYI